MSGIARRLTKLEAASVHTARMPVIFITLVPVERDQEDRGPGFAEQYARAREASARRRPSFVTLELMPRLTSQSSPH
jgi:hypothetical protein